MASCFDFAAPQLPKTTTLASLQTNGLKGRAAAIKAMSFCV